MSTTTAQAPTTPAPAEPASRLPYTGLLRSELRRLRLRRLVRLVLLLYVLMQVGVLALAFFSYESNDPAVVQAHFNDARLSCVQSFGPEIPPDLPEPIERMCGLGSPQQVAIDYGTLFDVAGGLPSGIKVTAVTFAVLAFLLGATSIGADWSARTLPGLLTWEPRRLRLLSGKLLALLLLVSAAAVVVQGVYFAGIWAIGSFRGTYDGIAAVNQFWPHALESAGRGVLLAGAFAMAGFAVSALVRNTAATLGVAFAYLTLGEIVLRAVTSRAEPWLVSRNADAWLSTGGADVEMLVRKTDQFGQPTYEQVVVHLSNLRGGSYLLGGATVLLVLAAATFRRRDLT